VRGFSTLNCKVFVSQAGENSTPSRTCIIASKEWSGLMIPQLSNKDATIVKFSWSHNGRKKDFLFVSLYLPYDPIILPPSVELTNIVEYSKNAEVPFIICCDSNSHHVAWGSSNINSRGRSLLEYLVTTDFQIANKGKEPNFVNRRRQEFIDITMISSSVLSDILNWKVLKKATLSDHRRIEFEISMDESQNISYSNPRKTDRDLKRELRTTFS